MAKLEQKEVIKVLSKIALMNVKDQITLPKIFLSNVDINVNLQIIEDNNDTCTVKRKEYIYFDWNVIKYMKTSDFRGPELYNKVKQLKDLYNFPYSEAHILDLYTSYSIENIENIANDLNFLMDISQNRILAAVTMYSTNMCLVKDAHKFFIETVDIKSKEKKETLEFKLPEFVPVKIDIPKLESNDPFYKILVENKGILDSNVMQNFLSNCWNLQDDPNFYKVIREKINQIKEKIESDNTVLSKEELLFKQILPFLEFLTNSNPEENIENFETLVLNSFCVCQGKDIHTMNIGEKLSIAYSILDFHKNYRDKINKKNNPSNLRRDIKHLCFAFTAKYYVTEDKSNLKKVLFLKEAFKLDVKVFKIDDFLNEIV